MKLTYVPDGFPNLSETFVLAEIRAMLRRGHDVSVASMRTGNCIDMLDWQPWQLIRDKAIVALPEFRRPLPSISALFKSSQVFYGHRPSAWHRRYRDAAAVEELVARIMQLKPELLVAHFCFDNAVAAEIASTRLGCPFILFLHGSDIYTVPHRRIRQICKHASAVATTTSFMETKVRALGVTCPIRRSPLGIDLKAFNFIERRYDHDRPRLVSIGRLGHSKNPLRTLKVFSKVLEQVPEAELLMVGTGPLEAECRHFIKQQGLNASVQLLGAVPAEDLSGILTSSSLFILLSDMEGLGVVFMEAHATGLPCIGTRVGGVPEVIQEGKTGYTVDPSDPNMEQMAADVICELLHNPNRLRQMGQCARRHAELNFDHEMHADRMEAIFNQSLRDC